LGLCPDPANLPAYAAMIADASQHRADHARAEVTEHAAGEDPTLASASAGTWLEGQGLAPRTARRRWTLPVHRDAYPDTGPVPTADAPAAVSPKPDGAAASPAPETARLARALRADARRAAHPGHSQDHDQEASANRRTHEDSKVSAGARPDPVRTEGLEAQVLASLMKRPADGLVVIDWLPPEAFSAAPHRDLYDLIRQRLASGRPVDPLIIAWDSSLLPDHPDSDESAAATSLARAALQISELDPAPGSAEVLGRTLWAKQILTTTLGEHWYTDPEAICLLATLAIEHRELERRDVLAAAAAGAVL
jgi:hypothetical protein